MSEPPAPRPVSADDEYEELVEEALCFGWIDSRAGKVDEERTMLRFTPRKRRSAWSRQNKEGVERLIADGTMTRAGLHVIESATREETRARRIAEILLSVAVGRSPLERPRRPLE